MRKLRLYLDSSILGWSLNRSNPTRLYDALVSYNFEHIVNIEIMVAVDKINRALSLNEIFLCQPQEVIISGS